MTQPTVALVYGRVAPDASEDEQDVLVQVETVRAALATLGRRTLDVPVTLDLASAAARLLEAAPVVAFNLAETIDGRGSLIHVVPSLLESLGIPFTGAPCEAIVLTSHKLLAKRALAADGIRTPRWVTAADAISGRSPVVFPPSWIVKSVWEHASIGLSDSAVVRSAEELAAETRRRSAREPLEHLFLEEYVDGREFNLALLGGRTGARGGAETPQSLPPAEIRFMDWPADKPRMVGWQAKWDASSPEYTGTPRTFAFAETDAPLLAELVRISRACWRLFSLRGYARVDFRVDAAGAPWVLEINTNPCLAPDAGFMAAARQAGLTIEDVVERIVSDAAVTKAACTE
jgi:D-alanine-D-alanine ligase